MYFDLFYILFLAHKPNNKNGYECWKVCNFIRSGFSDKTDFLYLFKVLLILNMTYLIYFI